MVLFGRSPMNPEAHSLKFVLNGNSKCDNGQTEPKVLRDFPEQRSSAGVTVNRNSVTQYLNAPILAGGVGSGDYPHCCGSE